MDVETKSGERFVLETSFNRGGEAEIWSVRREPHLVAKLYHQPTAEHEAKLASMIASAPQQLHRHPAVAWPLHLLYRKRRFIGYLMPRVNDSRPIFQFYNPARRTRLAANYPWRYFLHRTAQNLAAAVELVHDQGHIIGDLNESNVLVNREALVTLVDSDSFQIHGAAATPSALNQLLGRPVAMQTYRSLVGKAEFTAPELQGVDFKKVDRTPEQDNFALAIMIFYLLMEGYHPFAGVMPEAVTNQQSVGRVDLYGIRHGLFPHARNSDIEPPPRAPKLMWLAPALQAAFLRSFVEGHAVPGERPTAKEWRTLLAEAEGALIVCPSAAKHIYASHLRRCPHCRHAAIPPLVAPTPPAAMDADVAPVIRTVSEWLQGLPQRRLNGGIHLRLLMQRAKGRAIQFGHAIPSYYQQGRLALRHMPEQARHFWLATQQYRTLWQQWLLSYLLGFPISSTMALGFYWLGNDATGVDPLPLLLSPLWLGALTGMIFAMLLGIGQAWSLRTVLLRWRYLRELWVGTAAAAGLLLGGWIVGPLDLLGLSTWAAANGATVELGLRTVGTELVSGSLPHFQLSGLTLLFGLAVGWLQSFPLRQQLQRAEDGRIWTLINGVAWLAVAEGARLGLQWGALWQVADWQIGSWQLLAAAPPTTGLWLGLGLGLLGGLSVAALFTSGTLLWFLQGPRRAVAWPRLGIDWQQLHLLPAKVGRQLHRSSQRWSRALLLLTMIVLLLEAFLMAW